MIVQVHHNEIKPLITEGYEKVYDAMKRLLPPDELIFAPWSAGFGDVIQWELPRDYTWRSFAQADDYDRQIIINEFLRIKSSAEQKLGRNERLKKAVFSIPSEASVYYTVTPDGHYRVMLTGWGYSFPAQAPLTDITWQLPAGAQETTARFIENGAPAANLPFEISRNGSILRHTTDSNGEMSLGKLTPGTVIDMFVPSVSRQFSLTVVASQNLYTFDISVEKPRHEIPVIKPEVPAEEDIKEEEEEVIQADRTIKVQFVGTDGHPIAGRTVTAAQRDNAPTELTTDDNGCIYLSNNDFLTGLPVSMHIVETPDKPAYADAQFVIDADEDDYAIIYNEIKKTKIWLAVILALLAAAAAFGVIYAADIIDFH